MAKTIITTVTVPATIHDLTTLKTVKSSLAITGVADDSFLARTIAQCSEAVGQECNRVFALETVEDTVFLQGDGYPHLLTGGLPVLQLSRWPIVAVTSVTEDGTNLTAGTDFILDPTNGRLIRLHCDGRPRRWCAASVVATYQAGYVLPGDTTGAARTLPYDLEDAVCRLVATRWAERRRDPFVVEESVVGVGSTKYVTAGPNGNMPPDVADLLDNYRVPVTA